MNWHVDETTIAPYVSGHLDEAAAFSLEAHVLACPDCRMVLARHVETERRERIWSGVRAAIDRPQPRLIERSLVRFGVPDHTARLLMAAPAMRASWLVAVVSTLAFAMIAARSVWNGPLPFLVVAPMLPILGVAVAFGRSADPAWELGVSSPFGGFRLTLIRATCVLVICVASAGAISLALPEADQSAVLWLLPALALTVLTLVLSSTSLPPPAAASVVGGGWLVGVVIVERSSDVPLAAFVPEAQFTFAVVAVLSAIILVVRRTAFECPTRF
jgi:hypothetical protein